MRKLMTLLIASCFLSAVPVFAEETPATPQELGQVGFSSDEIQNAQDAISDQATTNEVDMQARWGRRCPRGYVLRAYRVRIGRIIIVRYRCERRRHWPYEQAPTQQEPLQQQEIQ